MASVLSRRHFMQSALAASALPASAASRTQIKIGLYSITYGGVWYRARRVNGQCSFTPAFHAVCSCRERASGFRRVTYSNQDRTLQHHLRRRLVPSSEGKWPVFFHAGISCSLLLPRARFRLPPRHVLKSRSDSTASPTAASGTELGG